MSVSPKSLQFQTLHPIWNSENQMSGLEVHLVNVKCCAASFGLMQGPCCGPIHDSWFCIHLFQDLQNHSLAESWTPRSFGSSENWKKSSFSGTRSCSFWVGMSENASKWEKFLVLHHRMK